MNFSTAFYVLFLLGLSCNPAKKAQTEPTLEKIMSEKITNPQVDYNTAQDFILCQEKASSTQAGILKYIIIRVSDKKILQEGYFRPGYIKWVHDYEIEIFNAPGVIRDHETLEKYKKTIFVRTLQSIP